MIRVGLAGLGAAARMVLPIFEDIDGFELAAAADVRPDAREGFSKSYGRPAFVSIEAMCEAARVDAVWIETPNELHCEHALTAVAHGKHVICAKPLGVTLDECERMIEAARAAGVHLVQAHCRAIDPPVLAMRDLVRSGKLGQAIQIETSIHNDWLQRPRLAEELDENVGGGVLLRQLPHQVDIVRAIADSPVSEVYGVTGRWDPAFASDGNYVGLLKFANGASATIAFNGYGWFDTTELTWGVDGLGKRNKVARPASVRRTGTLSASEKYAAAPSQTSRAGRSFAPIFGQTIVSCERGSVRQSPAGLLVYDANGRHRLGIPPNLGRRAELLALRQAIETGERPFPDGEWGRETLRVCLALRESARTGKPVAL